MQSVASVRKFAKYIFQDAIISVCSTLRPGFADEVTSDILLVWRSESKQVYQLQLSMFVIPILLSFCLVKKLAQCKTVLRQSAWQYNIICFGMESESQETFSSSHG